MSISMANLDMKLDKTGQWFVEYSRRNTGFSFGNAVKLGRAVAKTFARSDIRRETTSIHWKMISWLSCQFEFSGNVYFLSCLSLHVGIIMQLEKKFLVEEWYYLLFWRKNFCCPIKILSKFFCQQLLFKSGIFFWFQRKMWRRRKCRYCRWNIRWYIWMFCRWTWRKYLRISHSWFLCIWWWSSTNSGY